MNNRGFTLIEALLYIGFTVFLLAGAIAISSPLCPNADRLSPRTISDIETTFVLAKINHALLSASLITAPAAGGTGGTLSLTLLAGGSMSFRTNAGAFEMSTNGGAWTPITASRAAFADASFTHTAPASGVPRSTSVSFTLNGTTVGPLQYYVSF